LDRETHFSDPTVHWEQSQRYRWTVAPPELVDCTQSSTSGGEPTSIEPTIDEPTCPSEEPMTTSTGTTVPSGGTTSTGQTTDQTPHTDSTSADGKKDDTRTSQSTGSTSPDTATTATTTNY
jgi:hypothetical protein